MLKKLYTKVVGDPNEREVRKLAPLVEAINGLEPEMEHRTDADLRALTNHFRSRLTSNESLDDLLVDAFALVREVAKRTVDMRPFDVQLIGGIVLHQGKVAEMKTGEGKTLVATMPVYLNALPGHGVHLVTVNDYLARRDALWMGPVYHTLGLTIGLLQSGREQPAYLYDPSYDRDPYPGLRPVPRVEAYQADITYGTNNEFGFDYLRDNLALRLDARVQRPLHYAIVDEVDNVFIDEARTPLIISGPSGEPVEEYARFAAIARKLEPEVHFELGDKERSVFLTEEGLAVVEQETGIENIYDEANYRFVHYMQQAVKAQVLFLEGRDYIRQRKRIILIDQHTGRLMPSRRLSEGLHQAIEAKEGVPILPRDVTSATITIQNYFRMYDKLAGMSGTAMTEGEEFFKIYSLDVVAIPTNRPVIRQDHPDVVYRSEEAKLRAAVREILACHCSGQPVLVGTTSVEMSERLANRLSADRLQMAVLAPRMAYALQDADLEREERAALRDTMNGSLETMNSGAWRKVMRRLDIETSALSDDNLSWAADYLHLAGDGEAEHALERALREGIDHEVLNAKEHTREAAIIARAGEPGSVTIATNMAGRGVDIKLGGELSDEDMHRAHQALVTRGLDPFAATGSQMESAIAEVVPQYAKRRERSMQAGGLHVIGTERHEARRIDNQLRGRSGRQGEPGASRFFLSLEDDLMRRFGRKEMLSKLMEQIGDDFPIEHNLVSRTIERAQTSVEGYNFDIRKHLLEYDDVLSRQRETIYKERLSILQSDDLRDEVWRMIGEQLDEYLERYEDPDQQRLVFASLDEWVPLVLPSPKEPFQGPLTFAGHLTAFPPFTVLYLASQFAGQPVSEVTRELQDLAQKAALSYGQETVQAVRDLAVTTTDKYQDRLDRYQLSLDEKIEDYAQLVQERGEQLDPRRLTQHLERTFPLRLTLPRTGDIETLEDLREHWREEVNLEFHRQTCAGFIDRAPARLPSEAKNNIDRVRLAELSPKKLDEEMRRVLELAHKHTAGDQTPTELAKVDLSSDVEAFVQSIKTESDLDFGRLDRLVGHQLAVQLRDLIETYLDAPELDESGRLRRDLERIRDSVVEGKRGGRAGGLISVLRQLNDLAQLEIPDLASLLNQAIEHQYSKWAQRQLADMVEESERSPLVSRSELDSGQLRASDSTATSQDQGATWQAIAEYLFLTYYTQKQMYGQGHQRRVTWVPRMPFSFVIQAQCEGMDLDAVRRAVLDTLRQAITLRETTWGQQELRRWGHLCLDDLDQETLDSLLHYMGNQALDERGLNQDSLVDELPADLYEHLKFVLAFSRLEEQDPRVRDLPQSGVLIEHIEQALKAQFQKQAINDLDEKQRDQVRSQLQQTGILDDAQAQTELVDRPVGEWEQQTRDRIAVFVGQRLVEQWQGSPVKDLEDWARDAVVAQLEAQRRFVDEDRVQRFLVHESLVDLPVKTRQDALVHYVRSQLQRVRHRKISALDVKLRTMIATLLQEMGLFTDVARQEAFQQSSLQDVDASYREAFQAYLGRHWLEDGRLAGLEPQQQERVLQELQLAGKMVSPDRLEGLMNSALSELDDDLVAEVGAQIEQQLHSELVGKSMEELPAEMRKQIERVLDERDYFVDREKVRRYEEKTLAQLPTELQHGLEQHLGRIRFSEWSGVPLSELDADARGMILEFIQEQNLLDRARMLWLIDHGSLGELEPDTQQAISFHLGRKWLVSLRGYRPPALAKQDREVVWSYLRQQGCFVDEFKKDLFAYQSLDEFGSISRQSIADALMKQSIAMLESQSIADLPASIQSLVIRHLAEVGRLIDQDRLQQASQLGIDELAPDLSDALINSVGALVLEGVEDRSIGDLPERLRNLLWQYLDSEGYFFDSQRQSRIMGKRLADLSTEVYERLVFDVAHSMLVQIGDQPISDLEDDLRQGLRIAVEASGYFASEVLRERLLDQKLGNLGRDTLAALAPRLGKAQLGRQADKALSDLPEDEREAILSHLKSLDWFLDKDRFEQIARQRISDLDKSLQQDILASLCQQEVERLRQQRLTALDRSAFGLVRSLLHQQSLALDESQMRSLRSKPLRQVGDNALRPFLRDLGQELVASWENQRFNELPDRQVSQLVAYLGRQIMGRIERQALLLTISQLWIDYLTDIEDLRRGIGLEAYGQRDPLIEYKRRAFELFEELGHNVRRTVVRNLFRRRPSTLRADGA